jgi:hypothetical protein
MTTVSKNVAKEWAKGFLAFLVAIAGAILMWGSSRIAGFAYWFGTISGVVIMAVGMGYSREFFGLLIKGDLPKATSVVMKEYSMKEWVKVFSAFAAIFSGLCLTVYGYNKDWIPISIGIVLMAGGVTYFWTRSRFYQP